MDLRVPTANTGISRNTHDGHVGGAGGADGGRRRRGAAGGHGEGARPLDSAAPMRALLRGGRSALRAFSTSAEAASKPRAVGTISSGRVRRRVVLTSAAVGGTAAFFGYVAYRAWARPPSDSTSVRPRS